MRSLVRITFVALVGSFSLPATLITKTNATISSGYGGIPEVSCNHTGTTFSHCEAESFDPATGESYRAEATAEASYGYLSVESIISPNYENSPANAWATASFTDHVTVTGSDRIAYVEAYWNIADLNHNMDVFTAVYEPYLFAEGNTFSCTLSWVRGIRSASLAG